jgi:hypothetical protein
MTAITQLRYKHSPGRAYYDKKTSEGKTHKKALRSLKRRISHAIFARLQPGARPLSCVGSRLRSFPRPGMFGSRRRLSCPFSGCGVTSKFGKVCSFIYPHVNEIEISPYRSGPR